MISHKKARLFSVNYIFFRRRNPRPEMGMQEGPPGYSSGWRIDSPNEGRFSQAELGASTGWHFIRLKNEFSTL